MNADDFFKGKRLANIINYNHGIKQKNIKVINSFKTLYDIIGLHYNIGESYRDIISNPDSRVEFLINSVQVALNSETMDDDTKNLVFQMYSSLYEYLVGKSELTEIVIPNEVKEKIFKKNFMPSSEQLMFLMTLIVQNKKIYDNELDGKDFSQVLDEGLHKNITEVLSIEREKVSHILGMTSQKNSLYEFYRKITISRELKKIFGSDLDLNNYSGMIDWRFKDPNTNQLTQEEMMWNSTCELMPKSKTLDFYSRLDNIYELIEENKKVCDFTYEYIRKEIFEKQYNKGDIGLDKSEIDIVIENDPNKKQLIRELLDKCVENKDLSKIDDFQEKFRKEFGYSYPLIEYNKLLLKNISFYNFSLFENLNSIIVDYRSHGNISSDLFLVSYSQTEMKRQNKLADRLIKKERLKYENASLQDSKNDMISLDTEYLELIKSLTCFPPEERYYFRQMSNEKTKKIIEEEHNRKLLDKNMDKIENISLMGFATASDVKEKIQNISDTELQGFDHLHYCETNESTNYFDYKTDWVKNGVEYPIYTIMDQNGNVSKLSRYIDDLNSSIMEFNRYKYNELEDVNYSTNYEKSLIKKIIRKLDNYERLKELDIKTKEFNQINNYNLDIEKEELKRINMNNIHAKNYLNNYIKFIDENLANENMSSDIIEEPKSNNKNRK